MASPAYNGPRRVDSNKIVLTEVPQVFALKKPADGRPVGEFNSVMYTAVDERKLFITADDASDFHHTMLDMQIQPAEFIRVSRVKHGGRGGGFSIRVERVEDADAGTRQPAELRPEPWTPEDYQQTRDRDRRQAPPSRLEAELAASIPLARAHGAAAFQAQPAPAARETRGAAPPPRSSAPVQQHQQSNPTPAPFSATLARALVASLDAYAVAGEYAASKGLPITFSAEDVRASAISMCIETHWGRG